MSTRRTKNAKSKSPKTAKKKTKHTHIMIISQNRTRWGFLDDRDGIEIKHKAIVVGSAVRDKNKI